jgi:hypothetical protein
MAQTSFAMSPRPPLDFTGQRNVLTFYRSNVLMFSFCRCLALGSILTCVSRLSIKVETNFTLGVRTDPIGIHGGHEGKASRMLCLDTWWRWVVRFTLRPLYPREGTLGSHCIGCWVWSEPVWTRWWKDPGFSNSYMNRNFMDINNMVTYGLPQR